MSEYLEEHLKTPVSYHCDVLVCGGGTAGFCAALAAARTGAKTILLERFGFVGGTMINGAGPLHSFFNNFKAFPEAGKVQVVRGIPQEIVDRMMERNASPGHLEMNVGGNYDSVITCIDWEVFKDLAFTMLEEAGVEVLLHVMAAGAVMDGDRVTGVIIQGKSGREVIEAKTVVDATGDGDAAVFAGASFLDRHNEQALGFPFGMQGVDIPKAVAWLEERGLVTQLVRGDKGSETDDVIRLGADFAKIPELTEYMNREGLWGPLTFSLKEGWLTYINTTTVSGLDATKTEDLSKAEIIMRHRVTGFAELLKKHVPGFENAYICWTPAAAGVRFTRAIVCEYDISEEEIENCARFDDEILLYGFHDMAPRKLIKNGGWYGLPYRALIPKGVNGLLVAGRMVTSDYTAHMSTRNTVCSMGMGQAAGTAAALAAKEGVLPRELDTEVLRAELRKQGVFLG